MTLKAHSWAYVQRKPCSERMHAPQCSLDHCIQQSRHGSNLNVHMKMWYIYTMGYYSAIMPFAATWIDLESVILSEVS